MTANRIPTDPAALAALSRDLKDVALAQGTLQSKLAGAAFTARQHGVPTLGAELEESADEVGLELSRTNKVLAMVKDRVASCARRAELAR